MTQVPTPGSSLIPSSLRIPRCGNWLPEDTWIVRTWLANLVDLVDKNPKPLHPVIREFQLLIEHDPALYMLFHEMFDQIPKQDAYSRDPFGGSQLRDYKHMLKLLNEILTRAPIFNDNELIGLPINAILDWPKSTPAGITAFLNPSINNQIKKILDVWAEFLKSLTSASVLNESQTGWLGPPAQAAMRASTSTKRQPKWTFELTFICNPDLPHFGYKSWDSFFTRRFKPNIRPIVSPLDDSVIINPCEAAPYRIYRDLKKMDRFWIKGQPYSIDHMLGSDSLVHHFIDGTLYQAFLDATNYHRWHSPVSGTIVKAYVLPGAYFAEQLVYDLPVSEIRSPRQKYHHYSRNNSIASDSKTARPTKSSLSNSPIPYQSQSYHAAVATRAVIFIKANNPAIGLMCVMPVGMAEVSTCEITVRVGQTIRKGDELGMFHFGGSTICLIFRHGVELKWDMHGQTEIGLGSRNIQVNTRIATVVRKEKIRPRIVENLLEKEIAVRKGKGKMKAKEEVRAVGWRGGGSLMG